MLILKLLSISKVKGGSIDCYTKSQAEDRKGERYKEEMASVAGEDLLPTMMSSLTHADSEPNMICFSDEAHDATFHFQIICLKEQLYIWIGCNSAKLGTVFASIPTPYNTTPSLAALIGGGASSTGGSMARRLAMKTGWSILLASNLPSNALVLESFAERKLFQELKNRGFIKAGHSKGREVTYSEDVEQDFTRP
ncbi:hypothetical protein O6H91_02G000300 [Diphasiastrum complanatum]|uniref:Uncharacterized protein n=1 Tax=Diphasiastrum complanatum TaxID=34168 RepID=A0ACC2EC77_DIPCM|nr:hypothetical protein O6H91_02G000300 [Diphasiastrum complanatum]